MSLDGQAITIWHLISSLLEAELVSYRVQNTWGFGCASPSHGSPVDGVEMPPIYIETTPIYTDKDT